MGNKNYMRSDLNNNCNTEQTGDNKIFEKVKFIIYELLWAILYIFGYNIIFRPIDGCSYTESKAILVIIVVGLLCIRLSVFNKETNIQKAVFWILSFGIYTVISYCILLRKSIMYVGFVTMLLCIVYIIYLTFNILRNNILKKYSVKRIFKKAFLSICIILSLGCLIIMVPITAKTLLGIPLSQASTKAITGTTNDDYVLDNHLKSVSKIYDGSWKELSTKEKLEILQIVANIECNYMGLPHELNVCAEVLGENLVSRYDEKRHRIDVNISYLEQEVPEELLGTVCHEAYHAYEYQMVYLYDSVDEKQRQLMTFRNVPEYKEEFSSYTDGYDDFEKYESQVVESNARTYAKIAMQEYKTRTTDYIEKQKQ